MTTENGVEESKENSLRDDAKEIAAMKEAESKEFKNNLEYIWTKVEQTNPIFTKKAKAGGRNFTSICHTYQARTATALWGTYGDKWGLKNIIYDYGLTEILGLVHLTAEFFYPDKNDKEVSFEISNDHKVWYMTIGSNSYKKIDEDYSKKLETNTITKALSKLGFAADVFMGRFEDKEYVEAQELKSKLSSVDDGGDTLTEEKLKFFTWCETQIKAYPRIPKIPAVKAAFTNHIEKAKTKCELLGVNFNDVKDEKGNVVKEGIATKFQTAQRGRIAVIQAEIDKDNERQS